jgi:hypothetical protein
MYVDGTGDCASLTPCFTTIQQAVRLVESVDTEIRVFPGTYDESVDLNQAAADTGGTYGDLAIISVDATGAEASGAVVNGGESSAFFTTQSFDADLVIDGFTLVSAGDDGVSVEADGGITIRDVTANSVAGDGVRAVSNGGNILVEASSAQRSVPVVGSPDGLDLFAANGDVTVTGVSANSHNGPDGSNGIEIETANGNVLVHNSLGNFNADQGIVIDAEGDVHVTAAGAVGNGEDGLKINASGEALVDFFGASDNGDDGIDVAAIDDAEIRDSFAEGNGNGGIQVSTTGDLDIERVTVMENNLAQASVSSESRSGAIEVVAHPDASEPLVDTVLIAGSVVSNNGADGILLSGTWATAPVTVTSNAICQNAGAGFVALMEIADNLTSNWWGETTGPAHPDNPGGGGDEIVYAEGGGTFDRWITRVDGEVVSPPARAGMPAEIGFTFTSEDGGEIEQGLGWPGELEVTTDNGVLASDVPGQQPGASVRGQIQGGVLAVELTAADAGNADIDVNGPCGLGGELQVAVEAVRLFGDVDCDGAVTTVDALKELRFDAGLSVAQEPGCPAMGVALPASVTSPPWGDVDCDGAVGPVDGLILLRFDAGLEVAQEEGCPQIGNPLP